MHRSYPFGLGGTTARRARWATLVALVFALPAAASAQMGPAATEEEGRLELGHASAAARTAFMNGVRDLANIFPQRGVPALARAIELDPDFGIARVFHALQAPMNMEERRAELDRGVVDAARASPGEAIFAMALRAQRTGQAGEARTLFRSARALLPAEPMVAYFGVVGGLGPSPTPEERILALRRVIEQFPDHAPTYNLLAYGLYAAGDPVGALAAVRRYAELLPDHPNPKDSHAEILQWEGRLDEAAAHYREAVQLAPTYLAGYTGIADVRQLQGRGADARAALAEALPHAPTAQDRINFHRQTAYSFALDGNLRGAEGALGAAMAVASESGESGMTRWVHREMARVNALTNNGRGVAPHLAEAGAEGAFQLAENALLLAMGGRNAEAREALDAALAEPGAYDNGWVRRHAPVIRALILVNEGSGTAALTELAVTDWSLPTAQAVAALAEQQRRNPVAAALHRNRVLGDTEYALANVEQTTARALAARVK